MRVNRESMLEKTWGL